MSAAGDFVDETLQYEASWAKAEENRELVGRALEVYGASVGAVRAAIRAVGQRHPNLSHDDITALASELWDGAVYERRLAAIVLLQSHVASLLVSDLTRLEGFVRTAGTIALVDPLSADVIRPLIDGLDATACARAEAILMRWAAEPDGSFLARAAEIAQMTEVARPSEPTRSSDPARDLDADVP